MQAQSTNNSGTTSKAPRKVLQMPTIYKHNEVDRFGNVNHRPVTKTKSQKITVTTEDSWDAEGNLTRTTITKYAQPGGKRWTERQTEVIPAAEAAKYKVLDS